VLPGEAEAGRALAGHVDVDKVTFTGGPATARHVMSSCATQLTPSVMELGGKSANIVFADADIERSILSAARFVFNAGQGCSLPTRLIVQEEVYDTVVGGVVDLIAQVKVGDPMDATTQMGPVIDAAACDRIVAMVDRAVQKGDAKLLHGGHRLGGPLASGYFVAPTVLGEVDPASEIAQEEIFGPVLCASRFRDEDEAVALANGTRFGLAAYVQTGDMTRAHRLIRALDAGSVHINGSGPGPVSPGIPFGGVGMSGFGRQGSRAGLLEFVQLKNVLINT
jgi:aldehyde dehydrogenase (NAD+)